MTVIAPTERSVYVHVAETTEVTEDTVWYHFNDYRNEPEAMQAVQAELAKGKYSHARIFTRVTFGVKDEPVPLTA